MLRILTAGAAAGALDMVYAWITWVIVLRQLTTLQVPQSVATGLLGKEAYQGGFTTAALGLALHFTIATTWATVYFIAARRNRTLRTLIASSTRGTIVAGMLYGVVICLVMYRIVLPLSRAGTPSMFTWVFLAGLLAHMLIIGLPIALIVGDPGMAARRYEGARASRLAGGD
jgi:hypothetical protein